MMRKLRTAACLLLVVTVLTAFAALAADVGSQGDPLVSLSYLEGTFLERLLEEVDRKLEQRDQELTDRFSQEIRQREQELEAAGGSGDAPASFAAVEVGAGQTLWGSAGCQVLLRGGEAVCASPDRSTPGLVDLTAGKTIQDGTSLETDHLYLMTDSRGVTAAGSSVTLLVLGTYTLE